MAEDARKYVDVAILPDGRVVHVDADELQDVDEALGGGRSVDRASWIVPADLPRRVAFAALRRLFGDHGRVPDWTRRWRCRWLVDLAPSRGAVLGPFDSRAAAVDAEDEWLLANLF